ncbi:chemotaxis protein CheW [Spirochaetota bacterium]
MDISELIEKQKSLSEELGNGKVDQSEDDNIDEDIVQFVSFMLEDVEYGIEILTVHEILRIPDMTRLPNVPSFIIGVINLRGNIIPVVDVRERFSIPQKEYTEQTRIIVIETDDKLVGLLVDYVHQVVRIPQSHIDEPSDLIEGVSEEFISGIARMRDRLIVILNITNLIFEEDEVALENSFTE